MIVALNGLPKPFRTDFALGPSCAQLGVAQAIMARWQYLERRRARHRNVGRIDQIVSVVEQQVESCDYLKRWITELPFTSFSFQALFDL